MLAAGDLRPQPTRPKWIAIPTRRALIRRIEEQRAKLAKVGSAAAMPPVAGEPSAAGGRGVRIRLPGSDGSPGDWVRIRTRD